LGLTVATMSSAILAGVEAVAAVRAMSRMVFARAG
jgi:hypothetical protein